MRFLPAVIMASAALACAAPHSAIAKSHSAGSGEPTDIEMLIAVQHGFGRVAMVANTRVLGCQKNRKLAAMMIPNCILGSLRIAAIPFGTRITGFGKNGCTPFANDEFWCRYHMSIIMPGDIDVVALILNEQPFRFRNSEYGWEAIDP